MWESRKPNPRRGPWPDIGAWLSALTAAVAAVSLRLMLLVPPSVAGDGSDLLLVMVPGGLAGALLVLALSRPLHRRAWRLLHLTTLPALALALALTLGPALPPVRAWLLQAAMHAELAVFTPLARLQRPYVQTELLPYARDARAATIIGGDSSLRQAFASEARLHAAGLEDGRWPYGWRDVAAYALLANHLGLLSPDDRRYDWASPLQRRLALATLVASSDGLPELAWLTRSAALPVVDVRRWAAGALGTQLDDVDLELLVLAASRIPGLLPASDTHRLLDLWHGRMTAAGYDLDEIRALAQGWCEAARRAHSPRAVRPVVTVLPETYRDYQPHLLVGITRILRLHGVDPTAGPPLAIRVTLSARQTGTYRAIRRVFAGFKEDYATQRKNARRTPLYRDEVIERPQTALRAAFVRSDGTEATMDWTLEAGLTSRYPRRPSPLHEGSRSWAYGLQAKAL